MKEKTLFKLVVITSLGLPGCGDIVNNEKPTEAPSTAAESNDQSSEKKNAATSLPTSIPSQSALPNVATDDFSKLGSGFYLLTKASLEVMEAEFQKLANKECAAEDVGSLRYANTGHGGVFVCSPHFSGFGGTESSPADLVSRLHPMWTKLNIEATPLFDDDVTKVGWYMVRDARHDSYALAYFYVGTRNASVVAAYHTKEPNVGYGVGGCSVSWNMSFLPRSNHQVCTSTDTTSVNYIKASHGCLIKIQVPGAESLISPA